MIRLLRDAWNRSPTHFNTREARRLPSKSLQAGVFLRVLELRALRGTAKRSSEAQSREPPGPRPRENRNLLFEAPQKKGCGPSQLPSPKPELLRVKVGDDRYTASRSPDFETRAYALSMASLSNHVPLLCNYVWKSMAGQGHPQSLTPFVSELSSPNVGALDIASTPKNQEVLVTPRCGTGPCVTPGSRGAPASQEFCARPRFEAAVFRLDRRRHSCTKALSLEICAEKAVKSQAPGPKPAKYALRSALRRAMCR